MSNDARMETALKNLSNMVKMVSSSDPATANRIAAIELDKKILAERIDYLSDSYVYNHYCR